MKRQALWLEAPFRVVIREEELSDPSEAEVTVRTMVSAISAGSELLVYRGEAPPDMAVDATIGALKGTFSFPMKYGYAAVGEVISLGSGVDPLWQGRKVFSFQPHQSHFLSKVTDLHPVPSAIDILDAVFLPNMETAVTLLLDGKPSVGEQVAVFGQGVVGLLVTAILARMPLACLLTLDRFAARRQASEHMGAHKSIDPSGHTIREILSLLQGPGEYEGADLTYEVSGNPNALDQALAITGFGGRIVLGSWYGTKDATLHLGGLFHRSRIRIMSSQVSSIDARLRNSWTKKRLLDLAWRFIAEVRPSDLITRTFPFSQAEKAYSLLDKDPGDCLQVVLAY
ncbi:MAG: zinc-binding alcohol dehydrogenase [Thermodesulfobacteriota bacterium]|jgi:2-desacetyl-2-hydroxyethyl bacteriochlorophyllide A dehydrogenase